MFKKKERLEKTEGEITAVMPKKKLPKKAIVIIVVILVITAAAMAIGGRLLPGGGAASGALPVTAGTVERMDLERIVSIKGTISGSDSAGVFSASNYRIASISVEEGDKVTKGQILATLDAEDLESQYNVALINTNDAKKAYQTAEMLYAEGAIPKAEYDAAKSTYETAQYTLSTYNLSEKANITSPIDGTVTRVNCTVGRIAGENSANTPMFVIEDIDNLQMKVDISEYDISDIREGQTVEISADVLGDRTVSGIVSKISPTGEQKTGSTEMIIPVVIDVNKEDTNLIAGVTARAKILTDSRQQVLTVPIDAIFENPDTGETSIFLIENGVLSAQAVTQGLSTDFYTELVGVDFAEGTQVLLAPNFSHYDGMPVTVQ